MAFNSNRDRAFELRTGAAAGQGVYDAGLRAYMLKVYNYMASGVALTGIVAVLGVNSPLAGLLYAVDPASGMMQPSLIVWASMIVSIGMVFFMSLRINHMKASTAQALFWAYAALNGIWMSSIFLTYTEVSIVRVFFISAAAFAGLSLYGYTTKRDLGPLGTFLVMGLIGLVIASLVNIFLQSSMLHFIASAAGVLIFAGLTAYDTQKVKDMYYAADGEDVAAKKSILGALTLYLDFINLFLMLLRFFGERR